MYNVVDCPNDNAKCIIRSNCESINGFVDALLCNSYIYVILCNLEKPKSLKT
jgi:hypothetical protein